jgi:hypothetical protein
MAGVVVPGRERRRVQGVARGERNRCEGRCRGEKPPSGEMMFSHC